MCRIIGVSNQEAWSGKPVLPGRFPMKVFDSVETGLTTPAKDRDVCEAVKFGEVDDENN